MIPAHRILPSNAPPVDSDRVLRRTSGNANYAENFAGDPEVDSSDEDEDVPESNARLSIKRRHHEGSARDGIRSARDSHAERHARNQRLRALAQDPSSVFIAKYEDRLSGRKFQRRERIAEAILPDEKAQWQHHMLEEQAKEQQRKRAYLERERKELVKRGENAGQVVWSRVLDDAYQIAIRCVPPILGKKKMTVPDGIGGTKLAGRNELISRKIFQLTGQMRYRKQISSHNQVLRKFRVKNPHGFDVGTLERGKDSRYVRIYDTKNLQWDDDNGRLIYVDSNPQGSKSGANALTNYSDCMSLNSSAHFLNGQLNQSICIQSVDFAMNQYAPESEDRYLEVVEHQYTTLQSTMGARPQPLDEVPEWRTMFPDLASLEEKNEIQNCDIILFESSLAIGQPPRGKSRLSIKFNLDLYCHPSYRNWNIRTTFCEDKGIPRCAFTNSIETTRRKDASRTELVDVPFTSHWWRDLFSGIMKRRWEREQLDEKKIEETGHGHCDNECDMCAKLRQAARARLQEEDEHSNRYLQELSVTQELYATDRPAGSVQGKAQRRVAVFLWRFRRAWSGEAATTIWRRLNHPNQPGSIDPPLQLGVPSMITTLSSQHKEVDETIYLAGGLHDPSMQCEIQPSYWDNGWQQLANQGDDTSANGSLQGCAGPNAGYGYTDPSPSTQNSHDSGYVSQGTSYASQTPMMQGTDEQLATGGTTYMGHSSLHETGNNYSMEHIHETTGSYGYDDLQVHEMALPTFGPVDLYDSQQSSHSHLVHEDLMSRIDTNLFQFNHGHLPISFVPEEHSFARHESIHGPARGTHEASLEEHSELRAPQPLHAHASGQLLETALQYSSAAPLFPTQYLASSLPTTSQAPSSAAAVSCSNTEASMLLHLAQSGTITGSGRENASRAQPHASTNPSYTHTQTSHSTRTLHSTHGAHAISQEPHQRSSAHGSPQMSTHPVASSIVSSSMSSSIPRSANMSTTSGPGTSTSIWTTDALADLPAGLFLDVGTALGTGASFLASQTPNGSGLHGHELAETNASSCGSVSTSTGMTSANAEAMEDAAIDAFDPSNQRERVQETGRILGQLLGTTSGHGAALGPGGAGAQSTAQIAGAPSGEMDSEHSAAWPRAREYAQGHAYGHTHGHTHVHAAEEEWRMPRMVGV